MLAPLVVTKADSYSVLNVNFQPSGLCELIGDSCMEDTPEFYEELFQWIDSYFEEGNSTMEFSFRLTYFNTSSSKAILELLDMLKKYQDKGKNIVINWFYPIPDYDEMLLEAEDYTADLGIKMNLISYPNPDKMD
jgi:SiaC family regulatory phosphoprotein